MEESAKTRFLAYLKEKGIGQTKCEEMCGISRGYLSKIKDNFGTDMLNKISIAFPSLNVKWIISGLGEMEYKSEKEVIKNDGIESTKKMAISLICSQCQQWEVH